jgi:Hypothetical protein (DUF2513).
MELIRQILFYIEGEYKAGSGNSLGTEEITIFLADYPQFQGINQDVVYEHCDLMYHAGLMKTINTSTMDECSFLIGNLTNNGFDLLDKIRSDTAWNTTKTIIADNGLPMTLEVIIGVASKVMADMLSGVLQS